MEQRATARTVLVHRGDGFGPVSDWAILAMSVAPARALELQNAAVRRGDRVKTIRYDRLDEELGRLT